MEAFGRMITVALAMVGVVMFLIFYRTASMGWQREETVRSMSSAYAEHIIRSRRILQKEWEAFRQEIGRLGSYRAELSVYERRRFETGKGRTYLFTTIEAPEEDLVLTEGSYIRVVVMEEKGSRWESFVYGTGAPILAGGCIS